MAEHVLFALCGLLGDQSLPSQARRDKTTADWLTIHHSSVTSYQLPVASCQLPVASHKSPFTTHHSPFTIPLLHVLDLFGDFF